MQLDSYISDLLYRYECVIIPGFGAFLTQVQSARVHDSTNAFYPPTKLLSFNRQLQSNDGLLANYIAESDSSTFEAALDKIRKYTRYLHHELEEGKKIHFQNIGDFSIDAEENLQFTPSLHINYLSNSFGLASYVSPKVLREVYKDQVQKLEENTPLLFTPERREQRPYLKYAAIALIALSVSGFGGMKIYESGVKEHNFVEKQKADSRLESQIQEATFVIDNPLPQITFTINKHEGRYHVVAGAFRIESNAEKKVKQLADQGYNARIIGVNKYGLHQVVYASFTDRLEAIKNLRDIKRTNNRDAWLLVQDLSK